MMLMAHCMSKDDYGRSYMAGFARGRPGVIEATFKSPGVKLLLYEHGQWLLLARLRPVPTFRAPDEWR
jgi:hypothetical protein